ATTGASRSTLRRWRQVGAAVLPRGIGSTGVLPPSFPRLARVVESGAVSLDQALAISRPLREAAARADVDDLAAAEAALVGSAIGSDAAPAMPPDLLRLQACTWRDAIDPDGPEPSYEEARRKRSFTFGRR